jgi:hypothetical protein
VLSAAQLAVAAQEWPAIQPLTKTFHFPDASKAAVDLSILSTASRPAYRIECHQLGFEDQAFDYSGDFECRLTSLYSKEAFSTLFTDDPEQSRDWQSRARFLSEELVGSCADYPEYGRVRNFQLRRMKITLALSDIVLNQSTQPRPTLKAFDLGISVVPDSAATSAIAAPVSYKEPPYAHPGDNKDHSRICGIVLRR